MTNRQVTVTVKCSKCGVPVQWTREQLMLHSLCLTRGMHVAPACDDDCAAESSPWTKRRLRATLARLDRS